MLSLSANNTPLLLPADAQASIDLVSPLLADGIEDNYTIPFAVPTRGNEQALGHVHQVALSERNLVLKDARLGYAGQHISGGVLRIMGSSKDAVKASFSAEGLVDRLKGVKLRDALAGNTIDTLPDGGLLAHAKQVTMVSSPHPSHCFPMHLNPGLYGSENPHWQPSASTWDSTRAYAVNDLVELDETDPVSRKWTWQCTTANTNLRPDENQTYWRRVVFGLVNSYDVALQQYDHNTASGNYFAMVPWFRYDWLVRTALRGIGLKATGDWFTFPATPFMLLANSTPLDASEPTGRFGAEQTASVTAYSPGTEVPLPADQDTTPPFDDPSGRWNTASYQFTPDAAGNWTFRVHVEAVFSDPDRLAVFIADATGNILNNGASGLPFGHIGTATATVHAETVEFVVPFDAAQVGQPFTIRVLGYGQGLFMQWVTLNNCTIIGFREGGTALNTFREVIDPAHHVPDMLLADFLQAVADTFGLEVSPELDTHRIAFNIKAEVVRNYTTSADQGDRMAGPLEMDHGRAIAGLRFAWPVDTVDTDSLLGSTLAYTVDNEGQLSGEVVLSKQHAIVRGTRRVYHSEAVLEDGTDMYRWKFLGYSIPRSITGDPDAATDMPVGIKPVMMDEQWVDGRKLLMPRMEQAGESAFYATGPRTSELYICVNGLKQAAREDGGLYPGAMAWGLDNAGNECESLLLQPQSEAPTMPDYWLRWHQAWADTLVRSEPVTMDLLLDLPFLRGKAWHRIMPMQGQLYLLEKMPVTLGSGIVTDMLCKGAYLRRLKPQVTPFPLPPPPFQCAGEGCGTYGVPAGGTGILEIITSTGWFSTRNMATDEVVVYGDFNTSGDSTAILAGDYCVYASDEAGVQSGAITIYDTSDSDTTYYTILDYTSLTIYGAFNFPHLVALPQAPNSVVAENYGNLPLVTALPSPPASSMASNYYSLNQVTEIPAQHAGIEYFNMTDMPLVTTLPDFDTGAQVRLVLDYCPLLHTIGVLPQITNLIISDCGFNTSSVVDALVNALNPSAPPGGAYKHATFNGLLSMRTSASDANYNACIAAGWTIS